MQVISGGWVHIPLHPPPRFAPDYNGYPWDFGMVDGQLHTRTPYSILYSFKKKAINFCVSGVYQNRWISFISTFIFKE